MTDSLKKLMKEREALDSEIAKLRDETRRTALAEARELIAKFEIIPTEVGFAVKSASEAKATVRSPVAPQFRDPDTGATWSGRGKPPRWIAGKDRDAFRI
ncbi:H-NS histone family protein [Robbsia sp. KACC 23696]|uniref:H-NS histone family protein n=1 Tax=Robbsia sp. KACC 23696 TaxID=3149231 RepID=UPI00325AF639